MSFMRQKKNNYDETLFLGHRKAILKEFFFDHTKSIPYLTWTMYLVKSLWKLPKNLIFLKSISLRVRKAWIRITIQGIKMMARILKNVMTHLTLKIS